jgi:hypothetical protein
MGKKRIHMKLIPLALLFFCLVAVNGCGDDKTSSTQPESVDDLQQLSETCDASEEKTYRWIEDGVVFQVCENGKWVSDSAKAHKPGFDPCQFNFGAAWQNSHEDSVYYAGLDYISVWLGDKTYYNEFEKRMVNMCVRIGATPMIYAYVIAEFGKDHGMDDCDVASTNGKKSLCVYGADLIREYFADSIMSRYQKYAKGMADQSALLAEGFEVFEPIWMIEPDYYQYSQMASDQSVDNKGEEQLNGGIPDSMMGVYFKQIVDTIKTYLPYAKIAIDISPWVSDKDSLGLEKWFSHFDMSLVDYVSTSGGRTMANTEKIRSANKLTWNKLYETLKKPILADAGYDAGGKGTGHAKLWDDISNLEARAKDGVVGVMQMDAALDYPLRASYIRSRLQVDYPWCKE